MNKYMLIAFSPVQVPWLENCVKSVSNKKYPAKGVGMNKAGFAITFATELDMYSLQGKIADAAINEKNIPIYVLFEISNPTKLAASMPNEAFTHLILSGIYTKQELKAWHDFYKRSEKKESVSLSTDELLDLIIQRGGVKNLTESELEQLNNLQKS